LQGGHAPAKVFSMTLFEALEIVGGFSHPSKIPCQGFSIPAWLCKTGGKLRGIKGSVCEKCYALKGRYSFPNVKNAMQRRFDGLKNERWIEAMTVAIGGTEGSGYFRFFDSGDLQSLEMLEKIAQVARNLPHITFWLPTQEYGFVAKYIKKNIFFPENLTVRLSTRMVEGEAPIALAQKYGAVASGVSKTGFTCPSSSQGGKCLSCRACWRQDVPVVTYKQH